MDCSGHSDSDSPDDYEAMRKKNIAEKERMFAQLGLDNVIGDTKVLFHNFGETSESKTRKLKKKSHRDSVKQQSKALPCRRSLRIECQVRKLKRVRGFKGFKREADLNVSETDSCDNSGKEEDEVKSPIPGNKITVRFPWHKQLCSKINSDKDQSVCLANENIACEVNQSLELPLSEPTEDDLFLSILKRSSKVMSFDVGSSDDGSDWDKYDKVEFYASTSECERESDSSSNSSVDLGRQRHRREVHRRSSLLGVPSVSPEEITEVMLKNIAKRGMNKTYDSAKGTTCHQCRQKTLDTKTVCRSKRCVGVRGMFCGVCLPNRYGESVEKALKNPVWECPVCRGICNCSFCRAKAGKNPTGILYPTVKSHGYENVAAFLEECDKENDSSFHNEKKRVKIVGVREDS